VIISPANKYIFLHVPKTGGVSIRNFLRDVSPDVQEIFLWHCFGRDACKIIHNWCSYFRFGFVRNPWAAQLSMYKYIIDMGPRHPEWEKISAYRNFASYVDHHVRDHWENGRMTTQSDILYSIDGACLVSFIGRFEALERDFAEICMRVGLPDKKLPKSNQSEHGPYQDYYNQSSRSLVAEIFSTDIDRFNYVFD
jgi:hypothetical protein